MALLLLTLLDELPDGAVGQVAVWTSNSFEVQACASLGDGGIARRMSATISV
jgi:hypothetical protein